MEEKPSRSTKLCKNNLLCDQGRERRKRRYIKILDFPSSYNKVVEGEHQLDESKAPEWMDAEIKTKEFDISIDDRPKMARIGDYWSDKQTMEIVDLLKEYQDVFA
jgi:hypothetical protein